MKVSTELQRRPMRLIEVYPIRLGLAQMRDLGITAVFDLRSDVENDRFPCPKLDGIVVERIPVFKMEDYSPETVAK